MISEILERISKDFSSEFIDWLKNKGNELLKIEFNDIRESIENINPIDYKTLERFIE